jgi:hypothetical protein
MIAFLLACCTANAAEPGHPMLPTLSAWMEQSLVAYQLEGMSPSRAAGAFVDRDSHWVEATMGAIRSEQGWRTRPGRVEIVVGEGLDSSRYRAPRLDPLTRPNFVVDDVDIAMARDLWLTTDHSFKAAVEQFQIKTAALDQLGTVYPADWRASPPQQIFDPTPKAEIDTAWLHEIAVTSSQALRDLGGLRNADVHAHMISDRYVYADANGTRLTRTDSHAVVYAWADVLRDDGIQVYEYLQWVARTVEDLPSEPELLRGIRGLGQRVNARVDAPVVDYYEGPVVFEGHAAVDVFRYLAIPEILGTPPVPSSNRTYDQQMRNQPRMGRRLLGTGWSLVDDPHSAPAGLAGGFQYDREGVSAQRVEAVLDGYVRDLLMSNVPRRDVESSNGHSRGDIQGQWEARESVWRVTPDRTLSARAFDKQVERTMRESGIDKILVVRNLERGRAGGLPSPTDAVWRHLDGTEHPVLALDFQNVDRRALRDVIAAAGEWVRPYLMPTNRRSTSQGSRGLPAVGMGPAHLLVAEMELVFPGGNRQPHVLPPSPL